MIRTAVDNTDEGILEHLTNYQKIIITITRIRIKRFQKV